MHTNRIASRYAYESRFRVRLQRGAQTLVFEGWARDLSESGVGAFVGQTMELGEKVTLTIPVEGEEGITLDAEVARCLGTEYGFQFVTLSPIQRTRIRRLVEGRPILQD
jgi:PilZ domain